MCFNMSQIHALLLDLRYSHEPRAKQFLELRAPGQRLGAARLFLLAKESMRMAALRRSRIEPRLERCTGGPYFNAVSAEAIVDIYICSRNQGKEKRLQQ